MCFSVKKWHEKTSLACNFKRDAFLLTLGENFTRHGARIPESQLEKDSGKLNLLVSCQFPNHKVMLKCYIRYSATKVCLQPIALAGFQNLPEPFHPHADPTRHLLCLQRAAPGRHAGPITDTMVPRLSKVLQDQTLACARRSGRYQLATNCGVRNIESHEAHFGHAPKVKGFVVADQSVLIFVFLK